MQQVDLDFVEFYAAGEAATGRYHCSDCTYGVSVQQTLPPCPMCGGRVWELDPEEPVHFVP
jgi:tRNA(Arg) A34 adenosine deaminase TadA